MFFPDRIKNIQPGDRVLEIGPGSHPYHRSDVFLELRYEKVEERTAQFGHTQQLDTQKEVVFYDGRVFPFADQTFDYIICSHVLEHVEDVEAFLAEIFRVGRKGYLEYPLAYYDYLYNFEVHLNLLKFDYPVLRYMKKNETSLDTFKPIQTFFLESLNKGYASLIENLLPEFMEGFEWDKPFEIKRTSVLTDVLRKQNLLTRYNAPAAPDPGIGYHIKAIIKKMLFIKQPGR